jgi:hypothetical protein
VHYTSVLVPPITLDTSAGTPTGGDVDSLMFDVEATSAIEEASGLSLELAAGTFDVDVWFRRGTHVGSEGSSDGWQQLAAATGLVSAGGGALTAIPLDTPIDIQAGETIAFYIDTGAGEGGLQTDPGGAVGDPAGSDAAQTFRVGRALAGAFGAPGAAAIFRGSVDYSVCLPP